MGKPHRWFAAFFTFGTTMCALTVALLCFPGTPLDSVWRLNPDAHSAFASMGSAAIALMLVVGITCGLAAVGLWRASRWAIPLAIVILSFNIVGDLFSAVIRHDYRALIGLPIGGVMIFCLARYRQAASSSRR